VAQLKLKRLELDRSHVLAVGNSLAAPYVAETTRRALNAGRVGSPVRFGVLRASHSMSMRVRRTYVAGRVEVRARYAHMVHDGTQPHIIRPKRKQYLRFTSRRSGKLVFTKLVRHPGTRPRPWLFRALVTTAVPRGFRVRRTVTYRTIG
jgi:hypothetical protein